jgi:hypothetical protein
MENTTTTNATSPMAKMEAMEVKVIRVPVTTAVDYENKMRLGLIAKVMEMDWHQMSRMNEVVGHIMLTEKQNLVEFATYHTITEEELIEEHGKSVGRRLFEKLAEVSNERWEIQDTDGNYTDAKEYADEVVSDKLKEAEAEIEAEEDEDVAQREADEQDDLIEDVLHCVMTGDKSYKEDEE